MKYQKVRALIVGFVFSISTMTACGVYGSMESSVYGAAEEDVAVYGSPESFDSEYTEGEIGYAWSDKDHWEGFNEATNTELAFNGVTFYLPDYMILNEEESTDEKKVYDLEILPSGKSQLIIEFGRAKEWYPEETASDDWDGWTIRELTAERATENIQDATEEELLLDVIPMFTFNFNGEDNDLFEIMGEAADGYVDDYNAELWLYDDDKMISVTLVQNPAGRYNYVDDLIHILENAQID